MPSIWTRIAYIFNLITFSPTDSGVLDQTPLTSHVSPSKLGDGLSEGPVFRPPTAPSWLDLKCNYSAMQGYAECSTEGDRSCWLKSDKDKASRNFDISTDYEKYYPTGITRKYYLEIEEKIIDPDGVKRTAMVVNGSYPGPWLQACWGDDVEVTVKNKLQTNGTTIHWHGIRQLNTTAMDGVNAITQCPTAPGETFTYKFKALQYGTSWYHSHYSLQYGDGVLGPITIHGPSSADYDYAKPPVMMSDWSHTPLYTRWARDVQGLGGRGLDNILVNGTGTWEKKSPHKKYTLHFERGRRYLLRLINTSVDTSFVFAIDNHKIQVIGADFVPIVPYMTNHVVVGIGQRYHIVVTANPINGDRKGSYWMRTIPAAGCSVENFKSLDTRTGLIHYDGKEFDPQDLKGDYDNACRDEPYDKLVPVLKWKVGQPSNFASDSQFDIGMDNVTGPPFYPADKYKLRWNMYSNSLWLNFSNPTLSHFRDENWDPHAVVIKQNQTNDNWVYLLVSGTGIPRNDRSYNRAAHPIHLHGHDFAILQQSTEKYQIGGLKLNLENPPRRDVAFMPGNGFLVLAFKADNPGAWLMHCHIAWHASNGLALQILENADQIKLSAEDEAQMKRTCQTWDAWKNNTTNHFEQDDSGV